MSMRRFTQKISITEDLNAGLDWSVVEANSRWKKTNKENRVAVGLVVMATYTQVENELDLRLRYL